jgi:hypothetical protein
MQHRDSEHSKQGGGGTRAGKAFWLRFASQGEADRKDERHILKGLRRGLPFLKVKGIYGTAGCRAPRQQFVNGNETTWIWVWKRTKQDVIGNAEQRGRRRDSDRQHQHGDSGHPWRSAQRMRRVT